MFSFYSGPLPPSDVTAVQDGPTSAILSWTPSSDATGYSIHYTSTGGDNGNETASSGSTNTHILTDLLNGDNYTISIIATALLFPSDPAIIMVTLSKKNICINIYILSF